MAPGAPADRFLFHAFLALLLWMPLPFGSNVTWASSLMEAWVFLIAGLWLVQYYRGKVSLNRPFVRAWPVTMTTSASLTRALLPRRVRNSWRALSRQPAARVLEISASIRPTPAARHISR